MVAQPSPHPPGRLEQIRRAVAFAFPYRRAVGALFVITVILAMINAGEPLVLKYVFDELAAHRQVRTLLIGIAALVGLGLFREIASAGSNWLIWKTRIGINYSLLKAMVGRLHRFP